MANDETKPLMSGDPDKAEDKTPRRRMALENKGGEYTVNMVVIIEDFRIAFYLTTLFVLLVGVILTKAFVKEDYAAIITDVYGSSNVCVYVDVAPATYVVPVLWCFGVIFGFIYSLASIFRVRIAYLENKLSRVSAWLLTVAFIYVDFSIALFTQSLSVQPNREKPETMIVHTAAYINWKVMFAVLQLAVVWFGIRVSWVGLHLPSWFRKVSVVHAIVLIIVKIVAIISILNSIGDMGNRLEGKGLWWSVRGKASKLIAMIFVNVGGMLFAMIFPLIQAIYVARHGVNSHALIIAVTDNRPAAAPNVEYTEETP